MELTRRFIFHGHAAALGGRIVRRGEGKDARMVKDGFIDVPGSALTVAGGRSTVSIRPDSLKGDAAEVVKFDAARTFAEGVFDDLKSHYEVTLGTREVADLTTTTRVSATVEGLKVGTAIRLTVDRLHAGLIARSAAGSGETPVEIDEATGLDNVRVVDAAGRTYNLVIELDKTPFTQFSTYSSLMTAANDAKFVRKFGQMLFMREPVEGLAAPPPTGRLLRSEGGQVYGTIVKKIRWRGQAFPDSEIAGNMVRLPGWGRAYFGEILLNHGSRRLTMIRGKLGSLDGGDFGGGDVQDNGSWS
jgi:hypothetical protein